ncbi:hypothetical protein [Streptomyces sp. NBC_01465]|uniref:hypothetical protein n=1 Tax=Streptomyces sp. NBC_01465 TaxID=2903878 RepID=UPI002E317E89|nr:hypothetical protein [Streptomyces sp. NBC_01465]
MKVTTHRLFGQRHILREVQYLAPYAARLVERHVPGRLPNVEIVLTTPEGMTELTVDYAAAVTGASVTPKVRAKAQRELRREDRRAYGKALLAPSGAVVLLNARQVTNSTVIAETLVHELVHTVQFTRHGVRELITASLRENLGIEPMPRREARRYDRLLTAHESEAYRTESNLAPQLTTPSAA